MRTKSRLFHLLGHAQRLTYQAAERQTLATLGVTPTQLGLLYCLDRDRPVPTAEVGRVLELSAAGLSGLVDRMVKAGMITRVPNPEDGRAVDLQLLPKGAQVRDDSRRVVDEFQQTMLADLGTTEQAVIVRFLESLVARFGSGTGGEAASHDTAQPSGRRRPQRK